MARAGILSEEDRVELLDGEIVKKMTINPPHAACVTRLNRLFVQQLGDRAVVSVQNPIQLDDYSEPEPDISLLRPKDDFYAAAHPMPGHVYLVIEVEACSERSASCSASETPSVCWSSSRVLPEPMPVLMAAARRRDAGV
jgi:hypothetical protein